MGAFDTMRAALNKIKESEPVEKILESKPVTVVRNFVSSTITSIKNYFKDDDNKNKNENDVTGVNDKPGNNKDIMMSDLAAIDHSTQFDATIERSMLNGLNSMHRNADKPAEERTKIATAISAYTVEHDLAAEKIEGMGAGKGNAMSEMEKSVMSRIAGEYGLSTDELRKEYAAVTEETEECEDLIKKMGVGSVPQEELDKHPGLKDLVAYNTEEKFAKHDFDVDKFVQSDAGKAWLDSYSDEAVASADYDTDIRQQMLVTAMVPQLTEHVIEDQIGKDVDKAAERGAQADAELSIPDEADESVDLDAE